MLFLQGIEAKSFQQRTPFVSPTPVEGSEIKKLHNLKTH